MAGLCLVAACRPGTDDGAVPAMTPVPADVPAADAVVGDEAGFAGNPFVQDLWIYQRFEVVRQAGNRIDITDAVLEHFQLDDGDAVALHDGYRFHPLEGFRPHLKDENGDRRDDVAMQAGVLTDGDSRAVAVFGVPHLDAGAPIGPGDSVFIDLTFLGDAIEIGDVLLADYYFAQTMPLSDATETGLGPVALFRKRLDAGQARYFGDIADNAPLLYTTQPGRIVQGSNGGRLPAKSDPMMKGFREGVRGCIAKRNCVAQFFRKFGKGAADSNSLLDCNMSFGSNAALGCAPPDKKKLPPDKRKRGLVRGDPYLTTFDGVHYGMQAVGEFTLLQSPGLEVQIRTRGYPNGQVSIISGVALRVDDSRVVADGTRLRVDDRTDALRDWTQAVSLPGLDVEVVGTTVQIRTRTGHALDIHTSARGGMRVYAWLADGTTGISGLLGNADGRQRNDFTGRDGTVYEFRPGHEVLHREFAQSWRVTDESSLFDYAPREDTSAHTDLAYPRAPAQLASLDAGARRFAEAACRAAGITDTWVLATCMLDFGLTGDEHFIRDAMHADAMVAAGLAWGSDGDVPPGMSLETDATATTTSPRAAADAWNVKAFAILERNRRDTAVAFDCPPFPTAREQASSARIWGTDVYTDDSLLCLAAWHAGLITPELGGRILVEVADVPEEYRSTLRNDIQSRAYGGRWSHAIRVAPAQ